MNLRESRNIVFGRPSAKALECENLRIESAL